MPNRKLLILITAILFSGCVVFPTYTSRISLKTTRQNDQKVRLNNILLVGTGPVASRVFLDNLSAEMMQSLKHKGVQSEFFYVGNLPPSAPMKLDSFSHTAFDTYLVFKATGQSSLNMTKAKYAAIGPGGTATGYGNQYVNTYAVTLYKRNGNLQLVWQGNLEVDFDLANDSRYKHIANLIFKELVKKQVLAN